MATSAKAPKRRLAATSVEVKSLHDEAPSSKDEGSTKHEARHGKAPQKLPQAQTPFHGVRPDQFARSPDRTYDLPIEQIREARDNPRRDFGDLQALAASFKRNGQLQECVVRAIAGHGTDYNYILIAGARRCRAAKLAKFEALRCRIVDVTDEEAAMLRGEENYRRANFTPIEEAIWFRQLLATESYTQETLAKRLGCDRSHVANRLRLLNLPEEWQTKVAAGDIPPTHVRALTTWAAQPAKIFEAVAKKFDTLLKGKMLERGGDLPPVRDVEHLVRKAANRASRTLAKSDYGASRAFSDKVLKENEDALDIREVPSEWGTGKERRAFNTSLYKKLQLAAKPAKRKREEAAAAKGAKAKKEKPDEPDEWRVLTELWVWLMQELGRRLPSQPAKIQQQFIVWALVMFNEPIPHNPISALVARCTHAGLEMKGQAHGSLWHELGWFKPRHSVEFVQRLISNIEVLRDVDFEDLLDVAADFEDFDLQRDFRPTRELLELYPAESLATWRSPTLGEDQLTGQEQSVLVEHFLASWQQGYVPDGHIRDLLGLKTATKKGSAAGKKRKPAKKDMF